MNARLPALSLCLDRQYACDNNEAEAACTHHVNVLLRLVEFPINAMMDATESLGVMIVLCCMLHMARDRTPLILFGAQMEEFLSAQLSSAIYINYASGMFTL